MKRILTTGISVLLLSALAVPSAKAEIRLEAQPQQSQPTQMVVNETDKPVSNQQSTNNEQALKVDSETRNQLSERDRIVKQYQTQTVIPAQ